MVRFNGGAQDGSFSLGVRGRLGLPSIDERAISDEGCRSNSKSELVVSGTGVGIGPFVVFLGVECADGVEASEFRCGTLSASWRLAPLVRWRLAPSVWWCLAPERLELALRRFTSIGGGVPVSRRIAPGRGVVASPRGSSAVGRVTPVDGR